MEHYDFGLWRQLGGYEPLNGPLRQAVALEAAAPIVGPIAQLIGLL
jgi:hypothetical protein